MLSLRSATQLVRHHLLESCEVAAAVCDLNGRLLWASPLVGEWLGRRSVELSGQQVLGFVHPEDRAQCRDTFADTLLDEPREATLEIRLLRDDQVRWVRLSGRPMRFGRRRLFVLCLFDASDYAEMEAAARREMADAAAECCARAHTCPERLKPAVRRLRTALRD